VRGPTAQKIIEKQSTAIRKTGLLAGRFRWVICGLLFLGVTKNYRDRQVLGVLKGPLQHELCWNDVGAAGILYSGSRRLMRSE
jgi:hypothetical protein